MNPVIKVEKCKSSIRVKNKHLLIAKDNKFAYTPLPGC